MEHALPRRTRAPRYWALLMTSENHGSVGPAGSKFLHAPEKHERVQVMEIVEAGATPAPGVDLAGLVRIGVDDLIGKLGEVHDWARDLPIPTRGACSAMRKVREVKEALAATQAAANKAAEEGGLPVLPEAVWHACDHADGVQFHPSKEQARSFSIDGKSVPYFTSDCMRVYGRQAIAADRASRQVANKAEV